MPYADTTMATCHPSRRRKTAEGECDTCYARRRSREVPEAQAGNVEAQRRWAAGVRACAALVEALDSAAIDVRMGRRPDVAALRSMIEEAAARREISGAGLTALVDALTAAERRRSTSQLRPAPSRGLLP